MIFLLDFEKFLTIFFQLGGLSQKTAIFFILRAFILYLEET